MEKINEKTMQLMTFEKNEHVKRTREGGTQVQYLSTSLYSSNHNISRFQIRSDKRDLKSFKRLISNQKLL